MLDLIEHPSRYNGHLDCITELGVMLKRPIPKGEAFLDWIADEDAQALCTQALLSAHFTWEEIRGAYFDMTEQGWLPSIEHLQRNHQLGLGEEQP